MADAYNVEPAEVLDSIELFKHLETKPGVVVADDYEGIEKELRQLAGAVGRAYRNRW
jgi:hypothetical protein